MPRPIPFRLVALLVWVSVAGLPILPLAGPPCNAADQPASAETKFDSLEPLVKQLSRHREFALAWTRMGYPAEAKRELAAAEDVYQAAVALSRPADYGEQMLRLLGFSWSLRVELEAVRMREKARMLMIETFGLPEETCGFILLVPYKSIPKARLYVIYTVAPPDLTKEKIGTNPMQYSVGTPIRGSRSFVATYAARGSDTLSEPVSEPASFERIHNQALPPDHAPASVLANTGGILALQTARIPPRGALEAFSAGAVLLKEGQVATLSEGPCAGPLVVPRNGSTGADALATDHLVTALWVLKNRDNGAEISVYRNRLANWNERVVFTGKNITEISHRRTVNSVLTWVPFFRDSDTERLTRHQVQQLGFFYGLRHDLAGETVLCLSIWREPQISFDPKSRQWRLAYHWGIREIAGGRRLIVLDEQGKLISLSEFIVPD